MRIFNTQFKAPTALKIASLVLKTTNISSIAEMISVARRKKWRPIHNPLTVIETTRPSWGDGEVIGIEHPVKGSIHFAPPGAMDEIRLDLNITDLEQEEIWKILGG